MKTSWTKDLTDDVAQEVRGDFKSALIMRRRLIALLEDKIKAAHSHSLTKDGYETANWAFKQADNVGFERGIREVISLLIDD